jgi:hypothetical protein
VRKVALQQVRVVDEHAARRALHHLDNVRHRGCARDVHVHLDVAVALVVRRGLRGPTKFAPTRLRWLHVDM